jgi:Ni/Co efflux regulator RcnB
MAQLDHDVLRVRRNASAPSAQGGDEMRKMSLIVLAAAATAIALPAAAQGPTFAAPGPQRYDERHDDHRDRDRGRDYDRAGFARELNQIHRRVEEDFNRGVIGKKVAKAFFNRIGELQHAEQRAREKNGGWLRPDQRRDMDAAVDKVRSDLRLHEQRSGRRY